MGVPSTSLYDRGQVTMWARRSSKVIKLGVCKSQCKKKIFGVWKVYLKRYRICVF